MRLYFHENMRVFHDRLTTEEDRVYLIDKLHKFIKDSEM